MDRLYARGHDHGMSLLINLCCLALLAGEAANAASPGPAAVAEAAPEAQGLNTPGAYLHVSPGLGGIVPVADVSLGGYAWGIGGGYYLTRGRRFGAMVGGFFEHLVVLSAGDRLHFEEHNLRMGPELRLGARTRGVFAYGLVRAGLDLLLDSNFFSESVDDRRPVVPWIMGTLGGGVQGLIGRRFLLGGEGGLDFGGEAFLMLRLRLIVGVRF